NRKENLRIVNNSQNQMNARINSVNTSGYKGVSFESREGRYRADIRKDGIRFFLGYFNSPVIAALKYDEAAKELFGEYAWLNFAPERDPIAIIRSRYLSHISNSLNF